MYINSAPKNNSLSFLKHNRLNAKKPHSVRKQGFESTVAPSASKFNLTRKGMTEKFKITTKKPP